MAYRPRRLLVAAIPLLLTTLTACGDDPKPGARASASGTPSVTGTPSASGSGTASPGASASGTPGGSGTSGSASPGSGTATGTRPPGSPGASASGSASPKPLFLTLRLAKTCVQPGQEQLAAIRSEPGADFIIDTVYADKKEGTVHGGFKRDKINSEGKYDYTWTVLPGTPPGDAWTVVKAIKNGRRGQAIKRFRVAVVC